MQNWFSERVDAFAFLIAHPGWFAFVILFAWFSYRLHTRLFTRVARKQLEATFAGWQTRAKVASRSHETGIGSHDVLIMKPPRRNVSIALWTLVFFGGGAVFFWLAVLPDPTEQTFENWLGFGLMCAFSAFSIILLASTRTRIELSPSDIVKRGFLRGRRTYPLSSIIGAEFAGKNPATGITLTFSDGRKLRLLASNDGYADVMQRLQTAHSDLPRLIAMGRMMHSAMKRRAH
ncbi:hypothetical protein SLH49_05930 [Cognatiyoonia sp. IB215446]|uniref:hypothetical protein n=1 Tax=Cognatiyoonia sp. IB215446 TaxID=3097355 RepID=UPI002A0E21CF|nr:hypothetical protein [Cognatiyoonia sp. IB215446]MDX8347521.1 hypothetical protein [Cognatiyoonia sp. IB215446]